MRFWFFSTGSKHDRRCQRPAPTVRPFLESLEDRSVPSVSSMPASTAVAPSQPTPSPAAVNAIASLPHDQIHVLQAEFQQQTANATILLEVEQTVLGILQPFAAQVPQIRPEIASLQSAIPGQQATVNTLQNQTNLLNQLDDVQDQSIILSAEIQNAASAVPVLRQSGDVATANTLQSLIAAAQANVQALQPQITAAEVAVSTFV